MGTDETISNGMTDETTTQVDHDEGAEVTGLAMGVLSPLGSLDPGLLGADHRALARKAGERPHDDGMDEVIITSIP